MELNDSDETCVVETLAGKIKMEKSSFIIGIIIKIRKNN